MITKWIKHTVQHAFPRSANFTLTSSDSVLPVSSGKISTLFSSKRGKTWLDITWGGRQGLLSVRRNQEAGRTKLTARVVEERILLFKWLSVALSFFMATDMFIKEEKSRHQMIEWIKYWIWMQTNEIKSNQREWTVESKKIGPRNICSTILYKTNGVRVHPWEI